MKVIRIDKQTDLMEAFEIRKEVFVVEQEIPEELEFDEFDTLDGVCEHILVFMEEQPVGTGRLREVDGVGKLERICVRKAFRAHGLGKVVISTLEDLAREKGLAKVKLHGQQQAEGFYHKLGYKTASEAFMEDGIPHVLMVKEL